MKQGDYFDQNPEIVKIFNDLEQYKKFCQIAFGYGHDGYVYNEKDLYNDKSRALRDFCNFRKGKKRPYFKKFDKNKPVILMGYYNMIFQYNENKFLNKCKLSGVNGLIVVDLPWPETVSYTHLTLPTKA